MSTTKPTNFDLRGFSMLSSPSQHPGRDKENSDPGRLTKFQGSNSSRLRRSSKSQRRVACHFASGPAQNGKWRGLGLSKNLNDIRAGKKKESLQSKTHRSTNSTRSSFLKIKSPKYRHHDDGYAADDEPDSDNSVVSGVSHRLEKKQTTPLGIKSCNLSSDEGATLNSFPSKWQSHILQSSHKWKRYLALAQPFEPKSIQLDKVGPFLDNLLLNQENNNYLSHEQIHAIRLFLLEEGQVFLRAIKTQALGIVRKHYRELLSPESEHENQEGYWQLIAENVAKALENHSFLQVFATDAKPEALLDNPAVEALILEFFYKGDGCLADIFPDDFSYIVPQCTIALAITCIRNCLEEYWAGCRLEIPFNSETCQSIHGVMMNIINNIYCRGETFTENQRRVARLGMQNLQLRKKG